MTPEIQQKIRKFSLTDAVQVGSLITAKLKKSLDSYRSQVLLLQEEFQYPQPIISSVVILTKWKKLRQSFLKNGIQNLQKICRQTSITGRFYNFCSLKKEIHFVIFSSFFSQGHRNWGQKRQMPSWPLPEGERRIKDNQNKRKYIEILISLSRGLLF